jgi:hypothetical protein
MLNAALAAPVNPVAPADNVYPVPILSIRHPVNVATPATALTVLAVQVSNPPPGLVPIVKVTEFVAEVTVFPPASRIVTTG